MDRRQLDIIMLQAELKAKIAIKRFEDKFSDKQEVQNATNSNQPNNAPEAQVQQPVY